MPFLEPDSELWIFIDQIASEQGLYLYDLEKVNKNGLRIYVDKLSLSPTSIKKVAPAKLIESSDAEEAIVKKENLEYPVVSCEPKKEKITVEDCSSLCRKLMVIFTVEGERFSLSLEPDLEVGSPGVYRRLRLPRHIQSELGSYVKVTTKSGRKPNVFFADATGSAKDVWDGVEGKDTDKSIAFDLNLKSFRGKLDSFDEALGELNIEVENSSKGSKKKGGCRSGSKKKANSRPNNSGLDIDFNVKEDEDVIESNKVQTSAMKSLRSDSLILKFRFSDVDKINRDPEF